MGEEISYVDFTQRRPDPTRNEAPVSRHNTRTHSHRPLGLALRDSPHLATPVGAGRTAIAQRGRTAADPSRASGVPEDPYLTFAERTPFASACVTLSDTFDVHRTSRTVPASFVRAPRASRRTNRPSTSRRISHQNAASTATMCSRALPGLAT